MQEYKAAVPLLLGSGTERMTKMIRIYVDRRLNVLEAYITLLARSDNPDHEKDLRVVEAARRRC